MLDLGRADAERHGAERAVGGGVGIAADDRHARLGEPELRPDDVHDALLGVVHRVERDAELRAVAPQRLDLGARDLVGDRREHVERRDVVVLGGERQIGPAHLPSRHTQTVERLRARDLVDEVEVDVEQVGLSGLPLVHQVCLPHLFGHCATHSCSSGRLKW